jgi:hypothetical protein
MDMRSESFDLGPEVVFHHGGRQEALQEGTLVLIPKRLSRPVDVQRLDRAADLLTELAAWISFSR